MPDDREPITEQTIFRWYREWSPGLIGRLRLYTTHGDWHAAEDAVQEAFLALSKNPEQVAGFNDAGVNGWLYTTACHKAVDDYRKRKRHYVVDPQTDDCGRLDQPYDEQAAGHPVHGLLADEDARRTQDMADRCRAVLYSFDGDMRIALLLHFEQGWTSAQISAELGVPDSTVRGWWRRAKAAIEAQVGDAYKILYGDDEQHQNGEETP